MREQSSSLLVCVYEREREEHTQHNNHLSRFARPLQDRMKNMHQRAHFDTVTRRLPTSRPAQSLREYTFLSLGLFSLNI